MAKKTIDNDVKSAPVTDDNNTQSIQLDDEKKLVLNTNSKVISIQQYFRMYHKNRDYLITLFSFKEGTFEQFETEYNNIMNIKIGV